MRFPPAPRSTPACRRESGTILDNHCFSGFQIRAYRRERTSATEIVLWLEEYVQFHSVPRAASVENASGSRKTTKFCGGHVSNPDAPLVTRQGRICHPRTPALPNSSVEFVTFEPPSLSCQKRPLPLSKPNRVTVRAVHQHYPLARGCRTNVTPLQTRYTYRRPAGYASYTPRIHNPKTCSETTSVRTLGV